MISKIFNKKRYFIIVFVCNYKDKGSTTCSTTVSCRGYVSRSGFSKCMLQEDNNITNIVITNIIELNKKDFNKHNE